MKVAVEIADKAFAGKGLVTIIAFLQNLKPAYNVSGIYEGAALFLFKKLLTGPARLVFEVKAELLTETAKD